MSSSTYAPPSIAEGSLPTPRPRPVWLDPDSRRKWTLISLLAILDLVWIAFSDFQVRASGWILPISGLTLLGGMTWFYTAVRVLPDQRIAETMHASGVLIAYTAVAAPLSYLMTSLALPIVDPMLVSVDRWFGFDWPAWYRWVAAHPPLQSLLNMLYSSSLIQIALATVVLGFLGRISHMREMMLALILTSVPIIIISGLVPAASAWVYFGEDLDRAYHLAHFIGLRDGSYRILGASDMVGLITFPSFHTAIALIVPWACRAIPWLFWLTCVANLGVLVSIPSEGGHYLSDMVAAAIFTVAILFWLHLKRR